MRSKARYALAALVLGAGLLAGGATASAEDTPQADSTDTTTAPEGAWHSYADATGADADAIAAASAAGMSDTDAADLAAVDTTTTADNTDATAADTVTPDSVPPEPSSSCPSGTTYNGAHRAWSCMDIMKDNADKGHPVWIRVGKANPQGFGYTHAFVDHNLYEDPMLVVIYNNSHGLKQKNGRYLYGMYFKGPKGVKQFVEVYEQRTKGTGSPDNHEMGVVTAFCRNASYQEENKCPEWVNTSL